VVHQATLTIGWSNGAQQTMYSDISEVFSSLSSAAGL